MDCDVEFHTMPSFDDDKIITDKIRRPFKNSYHYHFMDSGIYDMFDHIIRILWVSPINIKKVNPHQFTISCSLTNTSTIDFEINLFKSSAKTTEYYHKILNGDDKVYRISVWRRSGDYTLFMHVIDWVAVILAMSDIPVYEMLDP